MRVVDHGVKFGVSTDEEDGDGWLALRAKMLTADIFVIATPIWMGQCRGWCSSGSTPSSVRPTTRRMLTYGKVGAVAVVGDEDGAHHVTAEGFRHPTTSASR